MEKLFNFITYQRACCDGEDQGGSQERDGGMASHPDIGGSHYLASKVNEAKDVLMGRAKGTGSAFLLAFIFE